ncbi:MAG TPA: hypothetical protein HA257_09355 [Candidatus Methanoperedenaceae archaeon]|nr:hypothetical protein [Candidatus Methanoperedenaceae archaeon]
MCYGPRSEQEVEALIQHIKDPLDKEKQRRHLLDVMKKLLEDDAHKVRLAEQGVIV